ncbi:hypothetical protein V8C34DRAFT_293917 [Trichoderma compactum]
MPTTGRFPSITVYPKVSVQSLPGIKNSPSHRHARALFLLQCWRALKEACRFPPITLRPELGALVQDLCLNAFYWTEFDKSHTEAFERAATRLGVSLDGWMEDNPWEAISQLVIAYTPNVRSLEVIAHEVSCHDGVGAFTLLEKMAAQVQRQVSLLHLRRLCVGHDDCRQVSLGYFGGDS